MSCLYELVRIPISRRCDGYYIRWYYNGWHYWLFYPGKIHFITEGEKYRTLGTQKMTIGSGQITQEQCDAIRTILNATEIYIYTDSGWGVVRVDPGSWIVYDHGQKGYEAEINVTVGSKYISRTGFSPAINVPVLPPSTFVPVCGEITIGLQTWMSCNYDINFPGSKVYDNDEDNRLLLGGLYSWNQVNTPGFIPYGWHLPSIAEWTTLMNEVGTTLTAGGELKEIGTSRWNTPNTAATDTYGFTMVGNGFYYLGTFWEIGETANLWASDGFIKVSYDSAGITITPFILIIPTAYIGVRLIRDVMIMPPPVATAATSIGNNAFVANWNIVAGATAYYLDVATDAGFTSLVPGFNNLNVGNVLTYSITGLNPATTYYYRVRSYALTITSLDSNTITADTIEAFVITKRGDGSGVAWLSVKVSVGCIISLNGVAKFYSDSAGTLNESSSWTPTPGSLQTRYIRCSSGISDLMFNDISLLESFGVCNSTTTGYPGWGYNTATPAVLPNVPSLTITDQSLVFPNLIELGLPFSTITTMGISLSSLPSNFEKCYLTVSGTITGAITDLPSTIKILGILSANTISGNVSGFPTNIEEIEMSGSNTITGNISEFPSSALTYIGITGSNTISGDIANLPSTVTYLYLRGGNTVSGDIVNFKSALAYLYIEGNNTITGDVADIQAALYQCTINGLNTVYGDIADLPDTCTTLRLAGYNTLTGDIADLHANIGEFLISGSNTLFGDISGLPAVLQYCSITGNCTITGDLSNLPAGIKTFSAAGSNTIYGALSGIPSGILNIFITGNNTISGDIGDLPTSVYQITIEGNNTISDYTGKSWLVSGYILKINPTGIGGLSSAEIDQLLIDIDTDCLFTANIKTIYLKGTNGAPTATSLTARNSLVAKGVTLTTN